MDLWRRLVCSVVGHQRPWILMTTEAKVTLHRNGKPTRREVLVKCTWAECHRCRQEVGTSVPYTELLEKST